MNEQQFDRYKRLFTQAAQGKKASELAFLFGIGMPRVSHMLRHMWVILNREVRHMSHRDAVINEKDYSLQMLQTYSDYWLLTLAEFEKIRIKDRPYSANCDWRAQRSREEVKRKEQRHQDNPQGTQYDRRERA
jgi:hypothetical protein